MLSRWNIFPTFFENFCVLVTRPPSLISILDPHLCSIPSSPTGVRVRCFYSPCRGHISLRIYAPLALTPCLYSPFWFFVLPPPFAPNIGFYSWSPVLSTLFFSSPWLTIPSFPSGARIESVCELVLQRLVNSSFYHFITKGFWKD